MNSLTHEDHKTLLRKTRKDHLSPAKDGSLPHWPQGNICGFVCLNYWLGEFTLCIIADRFEMWIQSETADSSVFVPFLSLFGPTCFPLETYKKLLVHACIF